MAPAGQVQISLQVNSASYTAGLKAAQKQLGGLSDAAKQAGASTVGSMQAASASIRALENPMSLNIRTLARFAAQSKMLQGVFAAAFPVVGVLAAGALVAKLGMEVAKFIKSTNEMPKAISLGFGALNLATKTSIDDLQLVNDKLDNAHAKFEKKVQNNAKIQIDEARIAMDKFAASIESGNAKLTELLGRTHVSGWAALLGQSGTADREGTAKAFNQQIDSNAYDLASADPGSKQEAAAKNALMASMQAQIAEARRDMALRNAGEKGDGADKEGNNVLIDKGVIADRLSQIKLMGLEEANATKEAQAAKDEASKAGTEAAKEAARKQLQAAEEALNQMKLVGNVSIKQVYDYWAEYKATLTAGSIAYQVEFQAVQEKQTAAAVEGAAKAHEAITKAIAEQKREGVSDENGPDIINRYAKDAQQNSLRTGNEQNQDYVDNNQQAMDAAKNKATEEEAKLNDEAGRSMSRYAAAVALANVHSQEYVTTQEALVAIENVRQMQRDADPNKETDRNLSAAQMAVSNAAAQRQLQIGSDSDSINGRSTSAVAGFDDAINEFVRASQDAAAQMRNLVTNTIQGLNETLQHILVTPHMTGRQTRRAFRDYGAQQFGNVVGTGLDKAEGSLFGAFGGGKLGTKANPMVVTFADGTTSAVSSTGVLGTLGKMIGIGGGSGATGPGMSGLSTALGQSSEAADSDAAGGLSTIGSTLTSMIPFLASGGPIDGPAIVGEQGPELFMPNGAGTIIPNHKLATSSSTAGGHVFNIDARGSNDPAQVSAQVSRAIHQAAPLIAANTLNAQREKSLRRPASSNR